jgi:hypothetical protein
MKHQCLPNFMCGGASKCGTTTLYDILKSHPDVFLSSFKEPNFFNSDAFFDKGVEWYLKSYFSGYKNQKIIGDFSPGYLSIPFTAERIAEALGPSAKFIFILREPVSRAYSQFLHNQLDEMEELDFETALINEEKRMDTAKIKNDFISLLKFSYIDQSLYTDHLRKYMEIFGAERVKVLIFEDFFQEIEKSIIEVFRFLEINENVNLKLDIKSNPRSKARSKTLKAFMKKKFLMRSVFRIIIPSLAVRNKIRNYMHKINNKPEPYHRLESKTREEIYNRYFAKDVNDLELLLGRDLGLWKNKV